MFLSVESLARFIFCLFVCLLQCICCKLFTDSLFEEILFTNLSLQIYSKNDLINYVQISHLEYHIFSALLTKTTSFPHTRHA